MTTTYQELSDLFKLRDVDKRQLKIQLKNKLQLVGEDGLIATDEELKELITEFREGEIFDMEELCKQYGITENKVNTFMKNGLLSCFQLTANKGSKFLFKKSDIEKNITVVNMSYCKGENINDLLSLDKELIEQMKPYFPDNREYEVFAAYYSGEKDTKMLAEKLGMSSQYCNVCLIRSKRRVWRIISDALTYKKLNEDFARKYLDLQDLYENTKALYEKSQPKLAGEKPEIISAILARKLVDMDFSVRALNCLKAADINLVGDLIQYKINDLLKFRNFGTRSLNEIKDVMKALHFTVVNNTWHYLNVPVAKIEA